MKNFFDTIFQEDNKNHILLKSSIIFCFSGLVINLLNIIEYLNLKRKTQTLEFERAFGIAKPLTVEQIMSESLSILKRFVLYSNLSKISTVLLIISLLLIFLKLNQVNKISEMKKYNYLFLIFSTIIALLKDFFIKTLVVDYILIALLILTIVINILEILNYKNEITEENILDKKKL